MTSLTISVTWFHTHILGCYVIYASGRSYKGMARGQAGIVKRCFERNFWQQVRLLFYFASFYILLHVTLYAHSNRLFYFFILGLFTAELDFADEFCRNSGLPCVIQTALHFTASVKIRPNYQNYLGLFFTLQLLPEANFKDVQCNIRFK